MAYGALTALVALACIGLASIAFKLKLRLLRFAVVGLAAGYAIGFVTGFVLGFLRFSLPPFQLGNVAYTSSVWLPPVFGIAGMVMGTTAAIFKRPNAA
jgi:hypothetical protein